ncbi:alpha/beta hydrolase [Nocardia sp. CA2R105]|uniref:alpha/beta hydrolase n=1 Tax=Nocardia coffeae TaxID=2873381 RepID=UPI001CA6980E|nr:alpha/beta hydrolase [Nocardia coffeae]MBY8862937.1 alpha/beta hydrolase [Nocardia coffeae]
MSFAFDSELAVAVPMLPDLDFSKDLAGARAQTRELVAQAFGSADTTGVTVRDSSISGYDGGPDVLVRMYMPDAIESEAVLLDIHAGGFVMGDIETNHAANIELARTFGVVIVSVDYRLAPENPYPAALEDCYAALVWTAEQAAQWGCDPSRVVIQGHSAGGGLCAALALLARDRSGPHIAFQFLGVPVVDDRLETASMAAFTETPLWNRPSAEASWDCYLGAGVRGTASVSPYAAPARAEDFGRLPPAYISVMEFDPLRDEGIAYAQSLLAAGVAVELHLFPGTFHGSNLIGHAEISRRQDDEARTVLAKVLK